MKKTKEFYKDLFTTLHLAYGYYPFPKDVVKTEENKQKLFDLWDRFLGGYSDEHIKKGLDNAILQSISRIPTLSKIVECTNYERSTERRMDAMNQDYGNEHEHEHRELTEEERKHAEEYAKDPSKFINALIGKVKK
jgi:hypothetical protein